MDVSKYKKIFLEEAQEHVRGLGDGFVALERNPESLEGVDELFRHAHSMKGMASSMGYDPITTLSHAMEDVLNRIKKRQLAATREVIDLLLASLDRVEKMVREVEGGDAIVTGVDDLAGVLRGLAAADRPAPPSSTPAAEEILDEVVPLDVTLAPVPSGVLPARAEALLARLDAMRVRTLQAQIPGGLKPCFLEVVLDTESMALGARAFIVLSRLAKSGILVTSRPELEEVRRGAAAGRIEALVFYSGDPDELRRSVASIPEVSQVQIQTLPPAALAAWVDSLGSPREREAVPRPGEAEGLRKAQTVRVGTGILDDLINLVGELLIKHERLSLLTAGLEREDLEDELSSLGNLIHSFQGTIMGVRMMPLDLVAGRFPRMIRDLAHRSGKEVLFEVEGLNIELDRAILETVGEVLVHLLRNAVDHGLETIEARRAAGKHPEGRIRFRAYREKEWVFIQISDDGRGIDLEAVRAKALEMGLATAERLASMDRDDLLLFTTTAGFSTAREVTDVSGRGVGLDAVRSRVESLGGGLALYSIQGEGTTVTLKLPLSLAIIQILMVQVAGQMFGLPVSRVHRTVELTPEMVRRAGSEEYFKAGRSLVRLLRLADLLGIDGARPAGWRGPVILVEKGRRTFGLLVDEILGARDAVIKPLGQPLMAIPVLAGAAITGDGNPMLILDVIKLL